MADEKSIENDKPVAIDRRASHMSVEDALSPASSSGDSDSEHEDHEFDRRSMRLRPSLSHTSSTGAVGGILQSTLSRTYTQRTNVNFIRIP